MGDWTIRPMRLDDVPLCERLSAESFHELDLRTAAPGDPPPTIRSPQRAETWIRRTTHFIRTDPGGCWVVEDATGLIGMATSIRRDDDLWCLATYAVRPGLQGRGIGRPLLEAALTHADGCSRAMLASSSDPRATRRYHQAGFTLHPQMHFRGIVDRSAVPAVADVREGSAADTELMDAVDRRTRGAGHGPDHALMLESWPLLVSESSTGRGYAYVEPARGVALLAATDPRTATGLLWAALATTTGDVPLSHVTSVNDWAVDVAMAARLELRTEGYLGVRGMKPPSPYVHNGALL